MMKENLLRRTDFSLSLNGADPVEGDDATNLSDLGIVSGDLVTLLVGKDVLEKFVDQPAPRLEVASGAEAVKSTPIADTTHTGIITECVYLN